METEHTVLGASPKLKMESTSWDGTFCPNFWNISFQLILWKRNATIWFVISNNLMLELHRQSSYEVTWDKTVMNRPFKQIKPEVKVELISVLYHIRWSKWWVKLLSYV